MTTARQSRETRQERSVFTTATAIFIPTTTATNHHPNRANPATAIPIFKTHTMLLGRLVNRRFIFFSACFMISDLFFNRNASRSRLGVIEFQGQQKVRCVGSARLERTKSDQRHRDFVKKYARPPLGTGAGKRKIFRGTCLGLAMPPGSPAGTPRYLRA